MHVDDFQCNNGNGPRIELKGAAKGKPMTYSDAAALFNVLKQKTGVNIHAHLLRHTHATLFYQQTKDIKQIQERLGHAQIQTTMNMYLHPSDQEIWNSWKGAQASFRLGSEE